MTLLGGILLLAVFANFGCLWGGAGRAATAARLFLPVWAAAAAANRWGGVSRAGYTVAQELPILAVNFAMPATAAPALAWRLARA